MADTGLKFLRLVAGKSTEVHATQSSAGAGDAGKILAANGSGVLDITFLPPGVGVEAKDFVTAENLAAGDFVNIFDVSGTPKIQKADASNVAKEADGYVNSASTSGGTNTIYYEGSNTHVSGVVGGTEYYLSSTVPGGVTATPPTGAVLIQALGKAVSTTEINVEIDRPFVGVV